MHALSVRTFVGLLLSAFTGTLHAATLPPGFTESAVHGSSVGVATAMEFAPDGRLFICEQGGALRIVKNGVLLPTPFATIAVTSTAERGLLGVAFDPDFHLNHYVYVYYTTPAARNRVARLTANGDIAVSGSEVLLFEIDDVAPGNHNGGAIHFGPDRKLYVAVGDYADGSNSQSMAVIPGKMLRLNANGSIPSDNPFFATTAGKMRAIWALGLRNPFTFGFNRRTGRMFINDVGSTSFEEINDGIAASNYGWPDTEGATSDPRFRGPLYTYPRGGTPFNCAIVGGAFYAPVTNQFPAEYQGDYFFSDLCSGIIRRYDPATGAVVNFATGANQIVDLKVGADGGLYYLLRGGVVFRVAYSGATDERFTIGLGTFSGDAGRLAARAGRDASYAWRADLQIPWSTYTMAGGGTHPAMGDFDGDSEDETIVGLQAGGNGWLAIFDDATDGHAFMGWLRLPWPAYNAMNGEVFPAAGNLDADPADELVVGVGTGGEGYIAIFDDAASGYALITWRQVPWSDYYAMNGATRPAIGDVDGDRRNEIVVGLGAGSAGWAAVFEGGQLGFRLRTWIRLHWNDYNATGGGTWPAVGDVDGDGRGEILLGVGRGGGGWVEVVDDAANGFVHVRWLRLAWEPYNMSVGETHPFVANLDADGAGEVIIGHATYNGDGGWVEIFDDALSAFTRQGWRNADHAPARQAGAATYPTAGRMR